MSRWSTGLLILSKARLTWCPTRCRFTRRSTASEGRFSRMNFSTRTTRKRTWCPWWSWSERVSQCWRNRKLKRRNNSDYCLSEKVVGQQNWMEQLSTTEDMWRTVWEKTCCLFSHRSRRVSWSSTRICPQMISSIFFYWSFGFKSKLTNNHWGQISCQCGKKKRKTIMLFQRPDVSSRLFREQKPKLFSWQETIRGWCRSTSSGWSCVVFTRRLEKILIFRTLFCVYRLWSGSLQWDDMLIHHCDWFSPLNSSTMTDSGCWYHCCYYYCSNFLLGEKMFVVCLCWTCFLFVCLIFLNDMKQWSWLRVFWIKNDFEWMCYFYWITML